MDLRPQWEYILSIARTRLENNKTSRHVTHYGDEIEVLGAAGEMAARLFLGLQPVLHTGFDHGADMSYRNIRIDTKATRLAGNVQERFLQWPTFKSIRSDVILMTAVSIRKRNAKLLGFALSNEIARSPINNQRFIACHEIPIRFLHPTSLLKNATSYKDLFTSAKTNAGCDAWHYVPG